MISRRFNNYAKWSQMAERCTAIRKQEIPDKHTQLQLGLCLTDLVPVSFQLCRS